MIRSPGAPQRTILGITACAVVAGWLFWQDGTHDATPAEPAGSPLTLAPQPPKLTTETIRLEKDDTMVGALLRHDLAADTAYEIINALKAAGANLRTLRPGDEFQLERQPTGQPAALSLAQSAWLHFRASEENGHWKVERTEIEPEIRVEVRQGEVTNSLWDAVENGAVAPSSLLEMVQIFESAFDFTADTRPGDRFRILVETRYANGSQIDFGRILAAQYISDDQTLTGIGFAASGNPTDRLAYYDADGNSLKRMFLRSPLEFSRISSGFTYRRPHPVLGGVRPHLAVDYAAPTGTPVWSVADGTVTFAGRKGGNGNQVVVRHRAGYETYYNHLSRIGKGIRRGKHVTQKQIIGYVGSTGISTGPHLDYRVRHNGKFVNPMNEKFLPGKKIETNQHARFTSHAQAMLARLDQKTDAPLQLTIDPKL